MKQRIFFNEVATRDGFQNEPAFVPTDTKVALVDALGECGYAKIEVTSFTSPKAIPMLKDADEVMGRIRRVPGVEYTVLVPNLRGAERALAYFEASGPLPRLWRSVGDSRSDYLMADHLHAAGYEVAHVDVRPSDGILERPYRIITEGDLIHDEAGAAFLSYWVKQLL